MSLPKTETRMVPVHSIKRFFTSLTSKQVGTVQVIDSTRAAGWVRSSPAHTANEIDLFINDFKVTTGLLEEPVSGKHSFSIGLYDVWRFAHRTDRIQIRLNGEPLLMPDGKDYFVPLRNGKENLGKLKVRLSRGQFFDEAGKIHKPSKDLDFAWQRGVLGLYLDVDKVIRQTTGSNSFIYSGTLLGYVRDNGFIPHDKDMDCAYVSTFSDPREVAEEFFRVGAALIDAGYHVTPKASCISVRLERSSSVMVDIAHLFVKSDGTVGFPFGTVTTGDVQPSMFEPVQQGELAGHQVGLPHEPDSVVETIYGPDWRIPDPDFRWSERRKRRDASALLSYTQRSMLAMDDYYAKPLTPVISRFAQWLAERVEFGQFSAIYDIGCGDGRDASALTRPGIRTIGVDRSRYAIAATESSATGREFAEVLQVDVLDDGVLADVVRANRRSGSVLIYCRFFLSGLTEQEESRFFGILGDVTHSGDYVAFEHRSDDDTHRKKELFRSFRRFLSAESTFEQLGDAGFEVTAHDAGTDMAPFGREDPHVVRIIAKRI